jgi:Protein of unknown function (DUF1203)
MTALRFIGLDSATVESLQGGAPDANGQPPERQLSDGGGNPCRHCLEDMPEGTPFLVLAHRPFPAPQPYAEVGPIFLHAEDCPHYEETGAPEMFTRRETILIRGYGSDDRIVYGSGKVIPTTQIESAAKEIFQDPKIAYIHLRSASNNCYQCRIERG